MPTREVPREEWRTFLNRFSQEHQGWPVRLEVPSAAARTEARGLPLLGISADAKGSDADAIEIMLGMAAGDHLTHKVISPRHLRFLAREDGVHEGVEIEAADGGTTVLRFEQPARPPTPHIL